MLPEKPAPTTMAEDGDRGVGIREGESMCLCVLCVVWREEGREGKGRGRGMALYIAFLFSFSCPFGDDVFCCCCREFGFFFFFCPFQRVACNFLFILSYSSFSSFSLQMVCRSLTILCDIIIIIIIMV